MRDSLPQTIENTVASTGRSAVPPEKVRSLSDDAQIHDRRSESMQNADRRKNDRPSVFQSRADSRADARSFALSPRDDVWPPIAQGKSLTWITAQERSNAESTLLEHWHSVHNVRGTHRRYSRSTNLDSAFGSSLSGCSSPDRASSIAASKIHQSRPSNPPVT